MKAKATEVGDLFQLKTTGWIWSENQKLVVTRIEGGRIHMKPIDPILGSAIESFVAVADMPRYIESGQIVLTSDRSEHQDAGVIRGDDELDAQARFFFRARPGTWAGFNTRKNRA